LKKYLIFGLFFCAAALPGLFAATVSCLVIETGLPSANPKSQYSTMWENVLMDVLFEAGHIVSNGRMARLDRKPEESFPAEAKMVYEEAKGNGMDYFLIAIIDNPDSNETAKPRAAYLRLFSTRSQELIKEQVYTDNKPASAKEESENIQRTIGLIATQIK
jgi:hypothetical protein